MRPEFWVSRAKQYRLTDDEIKSFTDPNDLQARLDQFDRLMVREARAEAENLFPQAVVCRVSDIDH